MPITLYKPTSSYEVGAIKLTTGDIQSCNLIFNSNQNIKYFNINNSAPILSSFKLSSAELVYAYTSEISSLDIDMFIDSYTIGLSSTTSSELTSIDINSTTRVMIHPKTGTISISSMTPGNYRFNYYGKTVNNLPFPTVTLSASIPVTVLSSTMVQTLSPSWNLPEYVMIPPFNNDGSLPESSYIYRLAFSKNTLTELDEIAAIYKCDESAFVLSMERGLDEASYRWKFTLNTNYKI